MTDLHEPPTSSESDVDLGWSDETVSERRTLLTWLVTAAAVATVVVAVGYVLIAMDKAQTSTTLDSASNKATSARAAAQLGTSDFTESDAGNLSHEGSFEESKNFPIELFSSHVVRTEENTLLTYRVFRDHTDDSFTTTAERSRDGATWEPVTMKDLPTGKLIQVDDHGRLLVAVVIDYSVDVNGDSYYAVSRDGLDWTPITVADSIPYDKWRSSTIVSDVAPLSDGRLLVSGIQVSVPDFDAFGFDSDNVCSHDTSIDETGTMTLEVWSCDDDSTKSITIPGPPINVDQPRLWTLDADGTNPVAVPMPNEGLTPTDDPLASDADSVTVLFAAQENPSQALYRGTTSDASSWDLEEIPVEDRIYPYRLASYGDTTYRTTTNADELVIQRSSDGGRTWTDTAPIGPEASVTELAVGPAGVAMLVRANNHGARPGDMPRPPFDYRAADGTQLVGELPGTYTTWVLTTPSGETFTYELTPSIQFPPGSGDDYGYVGESDPNVVVEFSSQGVPGYTLLSPIDGSTLLTIDDGDLWMAADHDATIEPAADQFGTKSGLYFSADDGATWEMLDSPGLKDGPIAVGDDEVLIANSDDTEGTPTRIAVPTK